MHSKTIISLFVAVLAAPQVWAHSLIESAVGDAGTAQSKGLGVDDTTPRDGTRRNPFQQDSTRFRGQRTVADAQGCGETLQGGTNSISSIAAQAGTVAQVSPGGTVTMQLRQINADGAGPYTCMVDTTGTGASFTEMTVTQNVAGTRGRDRQGQKTVHTLVAQMPAGMQCTGSVGGMDNVCIVRCQNPARAGPFGGCVPVQMVNANQSTGTIPAPVSSVIPAPSAVSSVGGANGGSSNGNNGNNNGGNVNGNNGNNGSNGDDEEESTDTGNTRKAFARRRRWQA